ncbi:lamin tail domain-containing protein [archaeon]|nr:lamin tail domain-containing protein [archaeon]
MIREIKKRAVLCIVIVFLVLPFSFKSAGASIIITEAMPNPSGKDNANQPDGEWVKISNNGSEKLEKEGCYFTDAIEKHKLNIGNLSLNANEERAVYRNGDKDFSLNNDGDVIRLYCSDVLVDEWIYGGSEEGVSIKRFAAEYNDEGEDDKEGERGEEDKEEGINADETDEYNPNADETELLDIENGMGKESQSILRILKLPENASYGSKIPVLVNAYRGDTPKRMVYVSIKGLGIKEKFEVKERFENVTKEIEMQIGCGQEGYNMLEVLAEGLDAKDSEMIAVDGKCNDEIEVPDMLGQLNLTKEDFSASNESDIKGEGFLDARSIAAYLMGAVLILLAVKRYEKAENRGKGNS